MSDAEVLVTEIESLGEKLADAKASITRRFIGQERVVDLVLSALLCGGHGLLIGLPGLGKTRLVGTLSTVMGLTGNRIQFTPDLMPSDITGTEVIQEDRTTGERSFRFLFGPVFSNVLLADEVNRTPPKTQAALLEAMQERQVSVGGAVHPIEAPFFVLATQNPIEQEGTYPLPEAQQDRFMFKVFVHYPGYDEEFAIAEQTTGGGVADIQPVLQREEILALQEVVRRVPAAPSVIHYALRLVRQTRPGPTAATVENGDGKVDETTRVPGTSAELIERMITFGAGPRAVQFLLLGGKARAALHGRQHVATEDIRALAAPVLRHRVVTNYAAEVEGYTPDRLIEQIVTDLNAAPADEKAGSGVEEVLKS